jgi:hypothetical protein
MLHAHSGSIPPRRAPEIVPISPTAEWQYSMTETIAAGLFTVGVFIGWHLVGR